MPAIQKPDCEWDLATVPAENFDQQYDYRGSASAGTVVYATIRPQYVAILIALKLFGIRNTV